MLEKNLQLGDSGENVKILQEKLKILGFYNPVITGSFGLATEEGVKAFQREYDLEETGIVDNEMWEMLLGFTEVSYYATSNYPTLSFGSSGAYVKDLQTKLKALLYYTGTINSSFDLETENAVKRLQYNNKLTTTGVVNNQTWELVDFLYGNLNECVTGNTSGENNYLTYSVKKGDTLYSIASKYNTTVDEIIRANNLTSNVLSVGQVLKIPSISETITNIYTVQSGDTLYSIASKYNTTVDEIKRLNNLTSNTLSVGQVLKIPSTSETTTNTYTVQSGDTLYSIASRYNTTVDEIKRLNNLTSNTLSVGQVLKISSTGGTTTNTYTVKSGDTLYSIASKYNTTVDEIKRLNSLTSNTLSIGQVLKIPSAGGTTSTTYTVKSGDTLYSIASKYNTTVDEIKRLNNLTSNTLSVGQLLKISM